MPLRIPLFMKKRGQRRTGVRWLGPLGEAVLFAALLLLGTYGIAMLMVGAIAPPLPWLVGIIPASLLLYGGLGLVELMWHSNTSTELRSAVARKAADLEQRIAANESLHALPAIPPISRVVDSPGVRLAYRLPIDTSPKWMLLGMTLICVCWNLLVGMFVYQVIDLHIDVSICASAQFLASTEKWPVVAHSFAVPVDSAAHHRHAAGRLHCP